MQGGRLRRGPPRPPDFISRKGVIASNKKEPQSPLRLFSDLSLPRGGYQSERPLLVWDRQRKITALIWVNVVTRAIFFVETTIQYWLHGIA